MNKNSKNLRRNLDLLAWNVFFAELRLYYPVAVLAFEAVAGSFTEAMSVFAVMSVSQAFLEVPTGVLSDKVGRRKTLIIGSFAEMLGAACVALAFSVPNGLLMLYAAAILVGFANAMFSGNNEALLYETLSYYRRTSETAKMIGRVHSMGQMGLAISGIGASICLLLGMNYQHLMVLSFFPVLMSFLLTFSINEPPTHKTEVRSFAHIKKALKLIMQDPKLFWLVVASAVRNGLGHSAHSFTPAFIESVWPLWMTSLYRTAQSFIGSFSFWFAGRVTTHFGLMKSLLGATLYSYFATILSYVTVTFFSPFLLLTTQPAYAVRVTADRTLKQASFSQAQRSTMGSLVSFAEALLDGVGAILAGVLADHFGPAQALLIIMLITAPTVFVYFKLYKAERLPSR
ncbi:MAG: MFS transporter [Bdellovibrionales bacterium]